MSAILPSIQSPKPTILMQPIKYRYPVCAFSASLPVLRSPTSALRPVVVHIPAFPTVLSAVRRRLLMNAGSRDGDDVITPVSGPQPVPGPESRVDSETTPVVPTEDTSESTTPSGSWLQRFIAKRKNLRAGTLRNYGVAAVIAYGLFDFITYTVSFLLSVRAYIAAGKTLTWGTLPQVSFVEFCTVS